MEAAYPDLTGRVELAENESRPFGTGGNSDIWLGVLRGAEPGATTPVALKMLRRRQETDQSTLDAVKRLLLRESRAWSALSHPNVLPMLGLCDPRSLGDQLSPDVPVLVSPFCANGTILQYVKSHPDVDVRQLLQEAGEGLKYMYSCQVVHGDVKPSNILISHEGKALLADFGLARIVDVTGFTTKTAGGSSRYTAVELIDVDEEAEVPRSTMATDVWAFGMTALELLGGKMPFYKIRLDTSVVSSIAQGKRPNRNHYHEVPLLAWPVLERCWAKQAADRPNIETVLNDLHVL